MSEAVKESPTACVRVLIVDDHELVRKGIRALLIETPGFEVVGEARNGEEAVSLAKEVQPDVILMDLLMPVMDGIEATRQITTLRPGTAVLVLTGTATDKDVIPAIRAGAVGYLLKDSSAAELVRGIRRVARGETSVDSTVARRLLQEVSRQREPAPAQETLTRRELEVLRLLAAGLSNRGMADQLGISERTVRSHMSHILGKLQLNSRMQAALYALREGLAEQGQAPSRHM